MEKRVVFRSAWLPYALVAPQIAVTIVFFFWPAAQAAGTRSSCRTRSASAPQFVGFENFARAFHDANYLAVVQGHGGLLRRWSRSSASPISLLLAALADRVIRGALAYKTLLIWPYAVAPAVAGVLWLFLFAPSIGIVTYALQQHRHRLEPAAQRRPGDGCWS